MLKFNRGDKMIDLKTVNSDIYRIDNKTKLTSGFDEILQSIKNRLLTRKGEFFLDVNYGLEYENIFSITQKDPSEELKRFAIRECILQDDRVSRVEEIEIQKNKRTVSIKFKAYLKTNEELEGVIELE